MSVCLYCRYVWLLFLEVKKSSSDIVKSMENGFIFLFTWLFKKDCGFQWPLSC